MIGSHGLAQSLPHVSSESVNLDSTKLRRIESIVISRIADGKLPGCVVCVGRQGKIAYLQAFGNRRVEPTEAPMTTDTVFDLASLTKPVATATSIMKLFEQQKLQMADPVARFLPEFGVHGKHLITIEQLLTHQSGLIADNPLRDYLDGPEIAWQKICELSPVSPVGEVFQYSDVNFIVLGQLVEKLGGMSLDRFAQEQIFQPLGMLETDFNPGDNLKLRAAPTEQRAGLWLQGAVHDPRAFWLNGVAGHAGLFSTASDLAIYAHAMLSPCPLKTPVGESRVAVLSRSTVDLMTRGYKVSTGSRGLGWDKQTGFSSNRGQRLTESAFGHGGFTGTVLWIDPELDLSIIFLSNRVHPNGAGDINRLAGAVCDIVVDSIIPTTSTPVEPPGVLLGIDNLKHNNFDTLSGNKVGLITNHTGRDRNGTTTAQLLHEAKNVELKVLFSPEHGFGGTVDLPQIGNSTDPATGLRIYSLYGATRKPTAEMLTEIDTLVFDIQDTGTRFYTYISTMGEAMRAAAEHHKRFVVLDRPNPINGVEVSGPMLDAGKESFVGYHALPVRHGMTAGELAVMFRDELHLDLDLQVVKCQGWHRCDFWDATNLTWINPSPNLRSLNQALLYPGIGLLETTNLSVGRGTDAPFEIFGAPWIHPRELAENLNSSKLAGVRFIPIEFTPSSSTFAGQACGGINVEIVDRSSFDPVGTGLMIAHQLRGLDANQWETKNFNVLLGNDNVWRAVVDDKSFEQIYELSQQGISDFLARRKSCLLYE